MRRSTVCHCASTVVGAVEIEKLDRQQHDRLAVAKFAAFRVEDKVPDGSTLIFGGT